MSRKSPNVVYVGDILSVPGHPLQYLVISVHDEHGDRVKAVKLASKETP